MTEPVYVAQTHEEEHLEDFDWFRDRAAEARAEGAKYFRYSWHAQTPRGLLIEGWLKQPEDEGEERWSFAA